MWNFRTDPNLHADPYSSKLPTIALQGGDEVRRTLADDGGDGPRFDRKLQLVAFGVGDAHAVSQRSRDMAADDARDRLFPAAAGIPGGDHRVGVKNSAEQLRRSCHGLESGTRGTRKEARRAQWRKRI
jgi:hypothetical protein